MGLYKKSSPANLPDFGTLVMRLPRRLAASTWLQIDRTYCLKASQSDWLADGHGLNHSPVLCLGDPLRQHGPLRQLPAACKYVAQLLPESEASNATVEEHNKFNGFCPSEGLCAARTGLFDLPIDLPFPEGSLILHEKEAIRFCSSG